MFIMLSEMCAGAYLDRAVLAGGGQMELAGG